MATFNYAPDFGATVTYTPSVKRIKFGDGYEQRVPFGINTNPQVWSLKFQNRGHNDTVAIDTFLAARKAAEAFDWIPPRQTVAIKVVCDSWSVEAVKANINTITATFRQVFQP